MTWCQTCHFIMWVSKEGDKISVSLLWAWKYSPLDQDRIRRQLIAVNHLLKDKSCICVSSVSSSCRHLYLQSSQTRVAVPFPFLVESSSFPSSSPLLDPWKREKPHHQGKRKIGDLSKNYFISGPEDRKEFTNGEENLELWTVESKMVEAFNRTVILVLSLSFLQSQNLVRELQCQGRLIPKFQKNKMLHKH